MDFLFMFMMYFLFCSFFPLLIICHFPSHKCVQQFSSITFRSGCIKWLGNMCVRSNRKFLKKFLLLLFFLFHSENWQNYKFMTTLLFNGCSDGTSRTTTIISERRKKGGGEVDGCIKWAYTKIGAVYKCAFIQIFIAFVS